MNGEVSDVASINASMVQGSTIGPSSYFIAESDLRPTRDTFFMDKFVDDVDLITTPEYYDQIDDEINHIATWAAENNLVLNKLKTKEIIFTKNKKVVMPPSVDGRERVGSLKKLRVILQNNLSMKDHVTDVISTCTNMVYALNMLRSHGLKEEGLQQIFNSKFYSKSCMPRWPGLVLQDRKNARGLTPFSDDPRDLDIILTMVKCLRSSAWMPMKNCLKNWIE